MKVIIIGGGIAGLTLALSLHQVGISARVYEAVGDLAPLGVGINLQPAAVRELTELGLAAPLERIGIDIRQLVFFNKLGQLIWSEPRGLSAGYRWPQYAVHRGRLQFLLLDAVRERLGKDNFRNGLRLTCLKQDSDRVVATFVDSSSRTIFTDEADILVGADGIHSKVRRELYPSEGKPRFARQLLWRAAVKAEPFLDGHTIVIAGHFDRRIVAYPIGHGDAKSKPLINWICQMTVAYDAPPRENWNRRVPQEQVVGHFGEWQTPWLDLTALIRRTPEIYEFPLVDRDPVEAWTFGRATLIGDAAHPMQPTGAQAGSQAVIDARTLTAALLNVSDPVKALYRYDNERRPIMNDIVLRNRRLGPEAVLQLVEERAPNGFDHIDDVVSRAEIEAISASFDAAAGLDIETVNGIQSIVSYKSSALTRPHRSS
jgi:2-polyprenyl-6-methoxyphenol hydroxylase-like FAD-dependent oxidoreductase